jgi:hypothetical protein
MTARNRSGRKEKGLHLAVQPFELGSLIERGFD